MVKDILKVTGIVLVAVFTRVICTLIFGGDPISQHEPFGNMAGLIGIIPSVIIMFFISYLHLAIVGFFILRKQLAGNYKNGFLFGSMVGFLWLHGMFEAGIIKNIAQYKELIFGISEAIPIIVLGLLVSYVLRREKILIENKRIEFKEILITLGSFTCIYLIQRYFSYKIIGIESAYTNKLWETFLWTAGNGIVIGAMYLLIKLFNVDYSVRQNIIVFGVLIFGIDWFLYNMFVPLFFNVSAFEIVRSYIVRAVMDIISICFSVYFAEKVQEKIHA